MSTTLVLMTTENPHYVQDFLIYICSNTLCRLGILTTPNHFEPNLTYVTLALLKLFKYQN